MPRLTNESTMMWIGNWDAVEAIRVGKVRRAYRLTLGLDNRILSRS
jgi:hypothetical protein